MDAEAEFTCLVRLRSQLSVIKDGGAVRQVSLVSRELKLKMPIFDGSSRRSDMIRLDHRSLPPGDEDL